MTPENQTKHENLKKCSVEIAHTYMCTVRPTKKPTVDLGSGKWVLRAPGIPLKGLVMMGFFFAMSDFSSLLFSSLLFSWVEQDMKKKIQKSCFVETKTKPETRTKTKTKIRESMSTVGLLF